MSVFSLKNPKIAKLVRTSKRLRHLQSISGLLAWDQETYLPTKGAYARAEQIETLSHILYAEATKKNLGKLLDELTNDAARFPEQFTIHDKALIRAMARDYSLASKLSKKLVGELSKHSSLSLESWRHARNQNRFDVFAKSFERMLELKREVAYSYGYTQSPYDALLAEYEEGLTAKTVDAVFAPFLEKLTPLVETLVSKTSSWDTAIFHQNFDEKKLWDVSLTILEKLGFNLDSGRQDQSTHPFTIGLTSQDVRVTTRVITDKPLSTILSSIHEGGHGMYEQGVSPEIADTRLGMIDSLVLHESQSRFFENMVGKSKEFWEYFFPTLQAAFPKQLAATSWQAAWKEANRISPSLIRVDADEVTYHFHIAIRFFIERDLIEKKLAVKDVPERWRQLYQQYLHIDVPDDLHGALQDIHWSQGLIGYFPTYSLGSFLSVQLHRSLSKHHDTLHDDIRAGQFDKINTWLAQEIHQHGKVYTSDELALKLTGKGLGSEDFLHYIKEKFEL